MLVEDFPIEAWHALSAEKTPSDVEMLAPAIWRVGDRVVKLFADAPLAQFRRIVRAHRQAGRLFRDRTSFAAQKLLAFDEPNRALLLSWVPGRSGRMELVDGADPAEVLHRAACWLAILHQGRERARGAFDAEGAVGRLPATPECAEDDMYARAFKALCAEAGRLQGREVVKSVLHGDMTLANLLFNSEAVTGIDFENLNLHPAARDVGELWADLLLHAPSIPHARGILPESWERAFMDAFPVADADICAFYTRHRLLKAWADIPAQEGHRGPGRVRKLANLHRLIENGALGVGVLG